MELTLPQMGEFINSISPFGMLIVIVYMFLRDGKGRNKVQEMMVKQDTERDKNLNLMRQAMQQQTDALTQRTKADLALTDGIIAAIENNNKRMDIWVQTMSASLGSTNEIAMDTKTIAQEQASTLETIKQASTTTQTQTSKILDMLNEKHQKETDLSDKLEQMAKDRSLFDEAVLEEIRTEMRGIEKATQETMAFFTKMNERIMINPPTPPPNTIAKQEETA